MTFTEQIAEKADRTVEQSDNNRADYIGGQKWKKKTTQIGTSISYSF